MCKEKRIMNESSNIDTEEPWSVTRWYRDDVANALCHFGIPDTEENITAFIDHSRDMLSDHTAEFELMDTQIDYLIVAGVLKDI